MARIPETHAREIAKKRVLIVDDHPVVRERVADVIGSESDLVLCGDSDNPNRAFDLINKLKPDLVITGLILKESHGLEFIKDIRARYPALPVVVFSMFEESLYAERVIRAGANGFVSKQESTQELLRAVRQVLSGRMYLSERVSSYAAARFFALPGRALTTGLVQLSDREIEIFELIGRGRTTREIASTLRLNLKTVQSYQARIKTKLQVKSLNELARRAQQSLHYQVIKAHS